MSEHCKIEAAWLEFAQEALPAASELHLKSARRVFFCGAAGLFGAVGEAFGAGEDAAELLSSVATELRGFRDDWMAEPEDGVTHDASQEATTHG